MLKLLTQPQPWKRVRYWLADLAEELNASFKTTPCRRHFLWIEFGSRPRAAPKFWTSLLPALLIGN